jgi:hypothetical protein
MTGPNNYREATIIVEDARCDYGCPHSGCQHEMAYLARAQVHATLALAAAVIATSAHKLQPADRHEWLKATDPDYAAEQDAEPPPLGPPIGTVWHGPGCGCPYCPPAGEPEVTR